MYEFIGKNGNSKTILFKMIAGFINKLSGSNGRSKDSNIR